ncbi:MAG: hypothetical protein ACXADS_12250 [Candidatus Thorarchaeota archaeon]|jgi:hypothetical protein
MSKTDEGWHRVLGAFDNWISYESTEFGPWTGYFSLENLRTLTSEERLGWMHSMYDETIPGRVEICREASVALEDFLPYMPDDDAAEVVQSMIDLSVVIRNLMLRMSDTVYSMMEEYRESGLDEISSYLSSIKDTEEEIRHSMSLYSQGFAKLGSMGLEIPEEIG